MAAAFALAVQGTPNEVGTLWKEWRIIWGFGFLFWVRILRGNLTILSTGIVAI